LNEYRPISLIGYIYKIVTKILANRLKKVMSNIIDERQMAFIKGRNLLHAVVMANEVVEETKRGKKPCLVFKVDYEKAYDSVSWNFLTYMMRRMGFCAKWIQWILGCLPSASLSILVNGSLTTEFQPQRGLRQGDPLAPLLFNIAAEGLTRLMRVAMEKNHFSSFLVGKKKEPVNILQYADDTIFFREATMENVRTVKTILRCFELASGLKINFAKSRCGAICKSEQWCKEEADFLNCSILPMPFSYLGIPIGANPKHREIWDPIIRKCETKLARWKQRHISLGGRVTLINAVLTTLPIYFFSFFRVPSNIIEKLINIQRRFLWGGGLEQKRIAWVNWETICLPKDKGRLGIKDLRKFNTTLLAKWRWEIFQHEGKGWTRILASKYGGWRQLDEQRSSSYYFHWWKDLKLLNQQQHTAEIKSHIQWKVGCGDKIKFWEDTWTNEDRLLMMKYANLYQISNQQ